MTPRNGQAQPASAEPLVAVVVAILSIVEDDLCMLLIKRSAAPFQDYWALPGGLLADGESLDRAAARKLLDETGVQDVYLEQLYTFGELSRGEDQRRGIAVAYFAPSWLYKVPFGQVATSDERLWLIVGGIAVFAICFLVALRSSAGQRYSKWRSGSPNTSFERTREG